MNNVPSNNDLAHFRTTQRTSSGFPHNLAADTAAETLWYAQSRRGTCALTICESWRVWAPVCCLFSQQRLHEVSWALLVKWLSGVKFIISQTYQVIAEFTVTQINHITAVFESTNLIEFWDLLMKLLFAYSLLHRGKLLKIKICVYSCVKLYSIQRRATECLQRISQLLPGNSFCAGSWLLRILVRTLLCF
jgi:hypothetical protein